MNILFLDIDGVLRTDSENDADDFHGKCCEALNQIIKETDCEIVLSADRRLTHTLTELNRLFRDYEIRKSPIGRTGYFKATATTLEARRGDEINEYLGQNKEHIQKWCAVDDMDLSPYVKNFVKTKFNIGLQEPGVIQAIISFLK
jgi:hypothetical protein